MSVGDEVDARVKLLLVLSALLAIAAQAAGAAEDVQRRLYAVNQSAKDRGSISVYDIDAGHRLVKTITPVPGVSNVRGVAASAVTGKLYVAYLDVTDIGKIYCLSVQDDTVVWNRAVDPGIDRLAIEPDGRF